MSVGFIYRIYCSTSSLSYVGQTTKPVEKRWYQHRLLLSRGNHHCASLQKDWNRYGKDSFEISVIEALDTLRYIDAVENSYCSLLGHYSGFNTDWTKKLELNAMPNDWVLVVKSGKEKGLFISNEMQLVSNRFDALRFPSLTNAGYFYLNYPNRPSVLQREVTVEPLNYVFDWKTRCYLPHSLHSHREQLHWANTAIS